MSKLDNCLFFDFETRSRRPIEDGSFAYAADPSTEILIVSWAYEDGKEYVCTTDGELIELFLSYLHDPSVILVAHNMLFEIAILYYVGIQYKWKMPALSRFRCTMQMSGRAGLPLALGDAAKALKITAKLDTGKALIKLFSVPQRDGKFISMDSRPREKAQFLEYGLVDTVVAREIYRNLSEWKPSELGDVLFDLQNNMNGVPIDVKTSTKIYNNVLIEQAGFAVRVTKLTKGVITKTTQVQRIKQWAQSHINPSIPSCDADHIIAILDGQYGPVDDVSYQILEMRQHSGKSSTGKYVRYINSSIDGYVYGMIISFGAHTGRGVSKLLNLYNLPKPSIKYKSMDKLVSDLKKHNILYINAKYGSYLRAASTAIRGMITAPKGKMLCVSDYAAIEARIVFWLSGCSSGLQKYIDGVDIYIDVSTHIFNTLYESVSPEQRWVGKQVILGAGFGLGPPGFVKSCARWGVEVALEVAEHSIYAYRNEYPEVVSLWNHLDNASMKACRTGKVCSIPSGLISFKTHRTKSGIIMLQMKLPSGRCINYPDVKIQIVTTPWGAKKKAITYKKPKDNGFYRESTYGGKITENAVQAIARDIFYYGAINASKNGYDILFGVYDEVISLHDKDTADIEEFNKLICVKPDWARGLPLAAEGKIIKHYQKI